jgi:hypothetical protein
MPPIGPGGLLPAYVILRGRIAVQEKIANPSNLGGPHQTMASSLTNLLYHIVFSTKERIPLIHEDLEETLYDYIGGSSAVSGVFCWRSAAYRTMSTCW